MSDIVLLAIVILLIAGAVFLILRWVPKPPKPHQAGTIAVINGVEYVLVFVQYEGGGKTMLQLQDRKSYEREHRFA